jgi:dTDP-4-dehydrorhamnose reductase
MIKILVTGAKGQLGSELKDLAPRYAQYFFIFTERTQLDVTNHKSVYRFITEEKIDIIINCSAYTAVDDAEEAQELANKINHLAVKTLAQVSRDKNLKLVHISTDYVFDGIKHRPYVETDLPNPCSVYGQTKLDGELALQRINPPKSIIIRTSWLYSRSGKNFVNTMFSLAKTRDELNVVADQIGTPTYTRDLANAILVILPKICNKTVEVFHYSNEGCCSWYDFAKAIFEIKEISMVVKPVESIDYPTQARRPFYSLLNKQKIKRVYRIEIPHWKDSLNLCINHSSAVSEF